MSELGIVGFQAPAAPPAQPPAGGAGDTGFQRMLDEASAGETEDPGGTASTVRAYNAMNLLNGKFPPPDSGAGFLFTMVAIMNEEAA